jgi:hypothetical protein
MEAPEMEEPEMEEPEMEAPEMDSEEEETDVDLEEIIRELEEENLADTSDINDENEWPEGFESTEFGDDDLFEMEDEMMDDEMEEGSYNEEMESGEDEEIDINEIVRQLREEGEEEDEPMTEEDDMEEPETTSAELEEAYKVIRFLRSKINEVNMLNAKLLYSNKLFKDNELSENQKMRVIENFDRAQTIREIKLVYSTLTESFKVTKKKTIKESYASKPVASTRPTSVLAEGTDMANRFKKLAGLIK